MTNQKVTQKVEKKKLLSPFEKLAKKKVKLVFTDGKTIEGVIKWIDKFEIILTTVKNEQPLDLVILKHSIKYLYEIK